MTGEPHSSLFCFLKPLEVLATILNVRLRGFFFFRNFLFLLFRLILNVGFNRLEDLVQLAHEVSHFEVVLDHGRVGESLEFDDPGVSLLPVLTLALHLLPDGDQKLPIPRTRRTDVILDLELVLVEVDALDLLLVFLLGLVLVTSTVVLIEFLTLFLGEFGPELLMLCDHVILVFEQDTEKELHEFIDIFAVDMVLRKSSTVAVITIGRELLELSLGLIFGVIVEVLL